MRVLAVTNGWPSERFPEYCVFNKRQVDSIRDLGISIDVKFINARELGKKAYLRAAIDLATSAGKYDLIHCFHGLSFLATRVARVRRPTVVSFLNAIENEYVDAPAAIRSFCVDATHRILDGDAKNVGIIVKDKVSEDLAHHPNVRCIPNGVDMSIFSPGDKLAARQELGLDPEALYFLFVSSKNLHRPQKRYDRFQSVLEAFRQKHPDRKVEELTLVSAEQDVVVNSYRAADAHVMTSDFEGSPNSIKEAMCCELPIVSTDVGNVARMTRALDAARLIREPSVPNFVEAIEHAISRPEEERAALRKAIVAQKLDAESVARQVIDLYEQVLSSGGKAAHPLNCERPPASCSS